MAFNPDKYLEKKASEGGFDPDAYLSSKEPSAEQSAEPSTLGDFGMGVHRGAMMGGAEELAGLGTAIGEKAADTDAFQKLADWYEGYKRDASPEAMEVAASAQPAPQKSFYQAYRGGQEQAQAETEAARKASPWAFGGGQVLGGLATGIASSPLAVAAPLRTAVGAGGLVGGLESSATIEDPLALAGDVALGGTVGAALQRILPGGVKKPAKDIVQRGELFPQLETAKQLGEEGISLSAKPEARKALTQRLQKSEQDIASQFIEPRKELGEAVGASLQDPGVVLTQSLDDLDAVENIGDVLTGNMKALGRAKANDLINKTQNLHQGVLTPQEAYQFRKELTEILPKIADPQEQQILRTGLDTIKGILDKSVSGFGKASKDFAQFAEHGPEALLSKGFDPEIADVFLGDLSKGNLKISEKVRDLLGNIRSGGQEGLKKQGEFFAAMEQLKKLSTENPELVRKLGIDPQKLTREFLSKADETAVAQKVAGEGFGQQVYERGKFGLRKATETGLLKAANVYGQTKKSTRDFVSARGEDLAGMAAALKQHGGPDLQSLAETLMSEVPQKRNAAIFSILQLPKAKDILGIEAEE
jgi:hypothetical protein